MAEKSMLSDEEKELKELWGQTQRYCTFESGPAWLHFGKLVRRETAKRCAELCVSKSHEWKNENKPFDREDGALDCCAAIRQAYKLD